MPKPKPQWRPTPRVKKGLEGRWVGDIQQAREVDFRPREPLGRATPLSLPSPAQQADGTVRFHTHRIWYQH